MSQHVCLRWLSTAVGFCFVVFGLVSTVSAQIQVAPIPTLPPEYFTSFQNQAGEGESTNAPSAQSRSAREAGSGSAAQDWLSKELSQSDVKQADVAAGEKESANKLKEIEKELDERIKELEDQLKKQAETKKEAEEAAKKKPTFQIGGRIHMDHWGFLDNEPGLGYLENSNPASPMFGTDPEDRFLFRRIRLEMGGDIPTNMLWRMQIDFNNPAIPEYKDVYLGWEELPGNHTFLVGNQKRPLGLDHLNSSRSNVFAERPLVVEAFNEDARRIGACFYGHSDDESLNWRYGIFNLENTANTGRYVGDSLQMGGYSRLVASPWYTEDGRCYSHWGLAGVLARPDGDTTNQESNQNEGRFRTRAEARSDARWLDTGRIPGADWYEILAAEYMVNYGPFQLTSEYMANFLQRDSVTPGTGPDTFFHGFYVYGSYFLTGEHMAYERTSGTLGRVTPHKNFFLADRLCGRRGCGGWGAWQIAARFDFLDLTDQDIAGGVEQNFTLGLNWYWNAYAKMQSNLIFGDIKDHRLVNGFDGGNFTIWGTRLMCDF